ncbi:MAG TPA: type 1 glutamine amidotransferase [Xanthomonadaceae bacterium]|jgi:GMP synthase-like glutamine amidotransferase|nr:type 1 glutamine amidotransferase [Xanthomonadaceae bacterium]
MTQSLIVVQHHPAETVGELGVWTTRRGVAMELFRADLDELPQASDRPCVLLGGPHSVDGAPDWLQREKLWLRDQLAQGAAVLGICLGSQLLADALGGRMHRLDRIETGWTRIAFADGSELDALQWHEDAFSLPPGCTPLARSAACAVQMFQGGNRIGIQFHPEWNASLVAALNAHFGASSPLPRDADADRHARVTAWFHRLLDDWRRFW